METTERRPPQVVAVMEDELVQWYARDGCDAGRARRAAGQWWEIRRWRIRVRGEYLRELGEADCPAYPHPPLSADGDPPDDCRCYLLEEGEYRTCAADRAGAIAVWRVEVRRAPRAMVRLRGVLRRLHPAGRGYGRRRTVLWGGRVERETNRLDRLLLGRHRMVALGDRWLRPRETELLHCEVCEAVTPHFTPRWPGDSTLCHGINHIPRVTARHFPRPELQLVPGTGEQV